MLPVQFPNFPKNFMLSDITSGYPKPSIRKDVQCQGRTRGGARPLAPSTRAPPLRGWVGAPMGEALLILHLIAFPFLRSGTGVYLRGVVVLLPPLGVPKIKIKRKLRLESNTWHWQRLRICLNSLLIQGEKSFSLLKRILHYTRCTMTESRLNDLALIALHPI